MRKTINLIIIVAMVMALLAGCGSGSQENGQEQQGTEDGVTVVATIFPAYDFARQIVGDRGQVTMLLQPGEEAHSFEPTPKDIITIGDADVFIYNGGESDVWVDEILNSVENENLKIINMMDCVEVVEEEVTEGMTEEEEHDHEDGEEAEYDEHVWTSPANAITITQAIAKAVTDADPDNAEPYNTNLSNYLDELTSLDSDFREMIDNSARKTVVFGDRFPARYFVEEYGLEYVAAFPGCSTETEPSAATIAYLIDKVNTEQIPVVFYIELSNQKAANTICESTQAKPLLFHTCHNITKEDFEAGETYVTLMRGNLENLQEALN